MSKKQIENLLKLNIPLIIINIVVFSKGLLGLSLKGNTLEQAIVITVILSDLLLVILGNYIILFKKVTSKSIDTKLINDADSWIELLENYTNIKVFSKSINLCIEHVKEIKERSRQLNDTLSKYFCPSELTYTEFKSVIDLALKTFYQNISNIVSNIDIVGSSFKTKTSLESIQNNEESIINRVKILTQKNSEILTELYNLNFELCNMSLKDDNESEKVLESLKKVIENVELYK